MGPGGCTKTRRAACGVFSLPMYPQLTDAQLATI